MSGNLDEQVAWHRNHRHLLGRLVDAAQDHAVRTGRILCLVAAVAPHEQDVVRLADSRSRDGAGNVVARAHRERDLQVPAHDCEDHDDDDGERGPLAPTGAPCRCSAPVHTVEPVRHGFAPVAHVALARCIAPGRVVARILETEVCGCRALLIRTAFTARAAGGRGTRRAPLPRTRGVATLVVCALVVSGICHDGS